MEENILLIFEWTIVDTEPTIEQDHSVKNDTQGEFNNIVGYTMWYVFLKPHGYYSMNNWSLNTQYECQKVMGWPYMLHIHWVNWQVQWIKHTKE